MTFIEQIKNTGVYVNLVFNPGTVSEVNFLSFSQAGTYLKGLDFSKANFEGTRTIKLNDTGVNYLDVSNGCDDLSTIQWRNKPVDAVIKLPTRHILRSDMPVKLVLKGKPAKDGVLKSAFIEMTNLRGLDFSHIDGFYKEDEIIWPNYNNNFKLKYSGPARLNHVIDKVSVPVKLSFRKGTADTECTNMFCHKRKQKIDNIISVDFANVTFENPVTNTARMFYKCDDLIETAKNFDGSNVTDTTEMYKDCRSLKKVDLSALNTRHEITNIISGISAPEQLILGTTTKGIFEYAKTYFNSSLKLLSLNDLTNSEELDISNVSNLEKLDYKSKTANSIKWPRMNFLTSLKLNAENFDKELNLNTANNLSELVLNTPKLPGLIINTAKSLSLDLSKETLLDNSTLSLTAPLLENLVLDNTGITSLDLTDYPVLRYINWSAKNCENLTDVVLFGYQAVNPDKSMQDEKNLAGCLNLESIIVKTDSDGKLSGRETHYTTESHSGEVTFNGKVNFTAYQLLEYIYPIGAVYISYNEMNPGLIFGGTWDSAGTGTLGSNSVYMYKRVS